MMLAIPTAAGHRRRWLAVVLALVVGSGCNERPAEPSVEAGTRVAQVEVVALQPTDWQQRIQTYGVVEAVGDVAVSVEHAGTVSRVAFDDGERVERGALLLVLDQQRQTLRVERARSAVDSAAAALQEARSTLTRRRGLAAKAAVSGELLENSEVALRRAAAAHDDALAALALAERELADSRVVSPVDGVIEQRQVEPGEVVRPGQVLARIQTVDQLRVVTFVGERDVNYLRTGAPATVTSPAARGRQYPATIVSIGVAADPRSGNFPVKLALGQDDGLLRPGMTARVTLSGLLESGRLLVPDAAVVDRNRRRVVYLAVDQGGRQVAREVRPLLRAGAIGGAIVGGMGGDSSVVVDGLSAGDRLIVAGLEFITDGSPIEVVSDTGPVGR